MFFNTLLFKKKEYKKIKNFKKILKKINNLSIRF